VSARCSRA